jgi:uncharacterized CHY-type Zn-finger protein
VEHTVTVGGHVVRGVGVGPATRCRHYDTDRDVVAVRAACCDRYYPCLSCHEAVTDHPHRPVPREAFDRPAVLCGGCGTTLSVTEYRDCGHTCPDCGAGFNPGCVAHHDRYFDLGAGP